jgi:predicted RNA methylase
MTKSPFNIFEAEVLPGLEQLAADDIRARAGHANQSVVARSGAVTFTYTGALRQLNSLKIATAVYGSVIFAVPRPKALMGHEHLTRLTKICRFVMEAAQTPFLTVGLDAAGDDSNVMQRLLLEIAQSLGLEISENRGDLNLRIRRPRVDLGWEVLIRLTPRPLATREWRVVNFKGAVFAPIAYAMAGLTHPAHDDRVLNLCCGSGTLLIERATHGQSAVLEGVDLSPEALDAAYQNLAAAAVEAKLREYDVCQLPYESGSFNVLMADLPFGHWIGSHQDNLTLYPAILKEATRVASIGARFVILTHEKRLLNKLLAEQTAWQTETSLPLNQNGLHPEITVLHRVN